MRWNTPPTEDAGKTNIVSRAAVVNTDNEAVKRVFGLKFVQL